MQSLIQQFFAYALSLRLWINHNEVDNSYRFTNIGFQCGVEQAGRKTHYAPVPFRHPNFFRRPFRALFDPFRKQFPRFFLGKPPFTKKVTVLMSGFRDPLQSG